MADEEGKKKGFVLEDELDSLDWDFRPFIEAHGTIEEPSIQRVTQLQKTFQSVFAKALEAEKDAIEQGNTNEADVLARQIQALTSEEGDEIMKRVIKSVGIVCNGSPSVEQIQKLPWRGRQAFVGWVVGTFLNPESSATVATKK